MATTSTERMRALVARRKAGIKIPKCNCGSKLTSPESVRTKRCSTCRRENPTSEERQRAIANAYKSMNRRAKLYELETPLEGFKWEWQEVEVALPSHTDGVLVETVRGAKTIGIYYPLQGWVDSIDGLTVKAKRWAEIPKREAS